MTLAMRSAPEDCAGVVAVHHLTLNFAYPAAVFPDGTSQGDIERYRQVFAEVTTALSGAGLGAATHITGTFAFAAAGKAIAMLLARAEKARDAA